MHPHPNRIFVGTCSTKPEDDHRIFPNSTVPQRFYTLEAAIEYAKKGFPEPGGEYCVFHYVDGEPALLWRKGQASA